MSVDQANRAKSAEGEDMMDTQVSPLLDRPSKYPKGVDVEFKAHVEEPLAAALLFRHLCNEFDIADVETELTVKLYGVSKEQLSALEAMRKLSWNITVQEQPGN